MHRRLPHRCAGVPRPAPAERAIERRSFLAGALALAGAAAIGLKTRVARAAARLRPPGARPGREFERACIRCFRCAEVCPVQCIRFDGAADLLSSDLPYLVAKDRGCTLCMKCTEACPTGALEPTPFDFAVIQQKVRMGVPVLDHQACISWTGKGVCRACFYACPYPGSAVRLVGRDQSPYFEPSKCVGCGLCEEACPDRARAIRIRPLSARPA